MRTRLVVVAVVAGIVALSVGVVWATSHDSTEVRVTARRLNSGRVEFALQQREPDGAWGDRILPTRRFFPPIADEGRWLVSSSVELPIPTPTPSPMLTVAEYIEWCGGYADFEVVDPEDATWADSRGVLLDAFEEVLVDFRRIEPPATLRKYHNSVFLMHAASRPFFEVIEEETLFEDAQVAVAILFVFGSSVTDEIRALPDDIRAQLTEAGCIGIPRDSADSADSDPSDETGEEPPVTATSTATPTPDPDPEPPAAGGPQSWRTLEHVIARDELWCGVKQTQPLFGFKGADGTVTGFDVEFCKALAAAVLGDATKVEYVDASDASTRFEMLNEAVIDVLIRTTTVTASRDRELGVDFAQTTFYTGQGFLVRKDSGYHSTADMGDATICVQTGTTTEQYLADHFTKIGLKYDPKGGLSSDVADAFFSGRCDVLTADVSGLASRIALRQDAADYQILPLLISKEPLAPAVRDYDSEWKDVVNWVVHGLIAAEELGITQANVHALAANPPNTTIARLLGVSYRGGEVSDLGFGRVNAQFIQRAIAAVGNYGEIYDRTIGDYIPRACSLNALAIDDSVDCPPGQGGILYALPYR